MVISLTGEPSVVRLLSRLCVTFLRSGNNSTQLPVFTLQCQPAKRGEREGGYTDSRPGLRASLGGVWKPPEPPPLRQRRSAVNEEGAGATPARQGFPTGETPPRPADHWEQETIGSSLPDAYFKSAGLHVMAASCCFIYSGRRRNFHLLRLNLAYLFINLVQQRLFHWQCLSGTSFRLKSSRFL